MKLKTLYEEAIKKALKEDPRTKKIVEDSIKQTKKEYKKLSGSEKSAFDKESLKHPYHDTRILYGSENTEVKDVMVGIDIGVPELLLADRLREKGVNIDLVISHHPSGRALAKLHKVMAIQSGIWEKYGLSKEIADGIMKDRIDEVGRGVAPGNNTRAQDAARLLKIPFMCCHTAADNCVATFLQKLVDKKKPKTLKNLITLLRAIPEYRAGMKVDAGPFILSGEEKDKAGKIFIDMTGGTSGPDKMFSRLSQVGIKTIVGMHCKESSFKIAKGEFLNLVIAGHMASDNLGMNLLFDSVEKEGKLNFIECSGFKRIRR